MIDDLLRFWGTVPEYEVECRIAELLLLWCEMAGGGSVSSWSMEIGASRVPSGTGVLAFRTVEGMTFLPVVRPSPDKRVGRFDLGFLGVL